MKRTLILDSFRHDFPTNSLHGTRPGNIVLERPDMKDPYFKITLMMLRVFVYQLALLAESVCPSRCHGWSKEPIFAEEEMLALKGD